MSDCITTYTGRHFDPLHPEEALICIEDIAHALSLICRGNGHVKSFFSVGQHCILCARDNDLLWYDLKYLLGETPAEPKPAIHITVDYTVLPFKTVEEEYLKLFRQLSSRIGQ